MITTFLKGIVLKYNKNLDIINSIFEIYIYIFKNCSWAVLTTFLIKVRILAFHQLQCNQ